MKTLLMHAHILLDQNARISVLQKDVLIEEHRIVAIGEELSSKSSQYDADNVVDLRGRTLLPAFFNLHSHLGENFFKSIDGTDWTLSRYLSYTEENLRLLSPVERDIQWKESARATCYELLEQGTIGICAGRAAIPCKSAGLISMSGYPLMNTLKLQKFLVDGTRQFQEYRKRWRSKTCSVGVLLHSLYMIDESILSLAMELLQLGADFFSMHLSEDAETRWREEEYCKGSPIRFLEEKGLLGAHTILAHCGFCGSEELKRISVTGATIVICPLSSMFLNERMADLTELSRLGVRWCTGTDGPATGRSLSLTRQTAALKERWPEVADEDLWRSITEWPAQVLSLPLYTGRIETGTCACFNVIDGCTNDVRTLLAALVRNEIPFQLQRF